MLNKIKKRTDELAIGSEQVILFLFTVAAVYAIVESRNFNEAAATFPRLVSAILLVGVVIWIFRGFLPGGIQSAFIQSSSIADLSDGDIDTDAIEDEHISTNYGAISLIVGYVFLCYLVGFLLASPVFVLAYMLWTRQPWYFVVAMPILAFGIVYLFMWLSGTNLDSGLFLENGVPI